MATTVLQPISLTGRMETPLIAYGSNVSYTAGNDLTDTNINSITSTGVRIKICVAISAAAILYLRTGGNNLALNQGVPLDPDTYFEFSVVVPNATAYSFRFSANCTVRTFVVGEGQ